MNDTRIQLHWAAQIAAGVGRTVIPQRPDDSNTAFGWSDEHRTLVQEPVGGIIAAVRPLDLVLLAIERDRVNEFPLSGRTLDEGFLFFEERFGRSLNRPNVELPEHAVACGGAFLPVGADLARLEQGFAAAAAQLERIRSRDPRASEVRCWPHHFDIATLMDAGNGRTIGVGWVPGDAQLPEPYWYVTPYPYPADRFNAPALPSGFWNTDGWFGAVLNEPGADVLSFLDAAIESCERFGG